MHNCGGTTAPLPREWDHMSIVLRFSIPATDFQPDDVLTGPPDMQIELEHLALTGDIIMLSIWATSEK